MSRLPGIPSDLPGSAPAAKQSKNAGMNTLADLAASASAGGSSGASSAANRLHGTMVLLMVVAAAAGVVYGMRKLGLGTRLALADFKIDYPLEKIEQGKLNADHEGIIDDLNDSRRVVQVPLEEVQTNPFEWKFAESHTVAKTDDSALAAERSRKELEERKRHLASEAQMLKLNSVLGGQVPVAQISGKVVRVGDVVNDIFKVVAIKGRSVELLADGQTFVLEMGTP